MILTVWDLILTPICLLVIYLISNNIKNRNIRFNPIYKYYLPGLFAKIFGGIAVCLIYVYYYNGGDTISYYRGGIAMVNLLFYNPDHFLSIMLGNVGDESRSFFNNFTGWPPYYMWKDPKTFFVIRFLCLIILVTFKSYIPATILLAWLSYTGIWKLYTLFCEQFPQLAKQLAISILYMPSVVFWGSGMLKDTITLSAACWFTYAIYYLLIKKEKMAFHLLCLLVSSYLLIAIKPYIFIALMPGALIWISHERIQKIKNVVLRIMTIPFILIISGSLITLIFSQVGGELGKYSNLDEVFEKAAINQEDLTRAGQYGDNYFDIGTLDPSVGGMLSKAPIAITATLYRPFLWEARNPVMLISALENTFILGLSFLLLFRIGIFKIIRYVLETPILLFSLMFSIIFAFSIGLSTPNFGALVRYKIPAIPFFLSSLFILYNYYKTKLVDKRS